MFNRCRACLGSSDNMKIVSQDEPEAKQLIAMFTSITNFEWITSEKVASCLCNECESALEMAYRFQRKCKESNDIIMKELEEDCLQCEEVETQREDSGDEGFKDVTIIKKKSRVREFSAEEVNQAIYEYKQKQSDGGFTCIVCHYVLATLRALSCHMSQTHKEIYNDWCYICNQTYQDVAEHRRTHTGLVESCRFCNKKIKKKHFVEHLRIHSSVRLFECRVCARGFLTNSSLQSHYNLRHDKTKENVRSSIKKDDCDEDDSSRHDFCEKKVRSLPVQVKSEEEESQTHVCNICNKELKSDGGLKKHLKLHRGDNPHKCSYCGKPHKSRGQLLDHERTHTGEKPYICNVCGKGFAQSGALGTHMKLHTGRPEVCKICQKRFCRPSELKLHLRKHSGEKPFLCTDCGKTFVQKSHLMEHIKTHSDVRPHKCTYCEKAFKQKSLLTSHLQIHSGYKPFQCSLCAYACFKSYRLQQHMKSHNSEVKKDKVHVCPVCQKGFVTQAMLNSHVTSSHNAIL